METNRQKKIARLLQKDLGEILQQESRNRFSNTLLTVTNVQITSDLSIARVYVSIFGSDASGIMKHLEMQAKEFRKQLGIRIKNQLRHVPELRFFIDDSLDYIENIEKLLRD